LEFFKANEQVRHASPAGFQWDKLGMHLLLAFSGNSTIHCHIFTFKISPTGLQVFI